MIDPVPSPEQPAPEFTANAWAAHLLAGLALGLIPAKLIDLAIDGPGLLVAFGFVS